MLSHSPFAFSKPVPMYEKPRLAPFFSPGLGSGGISTTRKDLTVVSQCQVTEKESFTAPVLVGTTLYVRDEKNIMAYDLGPAAPREAS